MDGEVAVIGTAFGKVRRRHRALDKPTPGQVSALPVLRIELCIEDRHGGPGLDLDDAARPDRIDVRILTREFQGLPLMRRAGFRKRGTRRCHENRRAGGQSCEFRNHDRLRLKAFQPDRKITLPSG